MPHGTTVSLLFLCRSAAKRTPFCGNFLRRQAAGTPQRTRLHPDGFGKNLNGLQFYLESLQFHLDGLQINPEAVRIYLQPSHSRFRHPGSAACNCRHLPSPPSESPSSPLPTNTIYKKMKKKYSHSAFSTCQKSNFQTSLS